MKKEISTKSLLASLNKVRKNLTLKMKKLLANIFKLIRYLTTAKDNETPSLTRILSIVGGIYFFILSTVVYMVKDQTFTPLEWASGFAALMTSIAVSIRVALPANSGNDPPSSGA